MNDYGEGDQHERERALQRGPETGVALFAAAGRDNAEDHEHGAGKELRSDEPGAEAQRLQPSGWHYRQRRGEPERGEARQESV